MVLWRVYQLLLACIGACLMIWISKQAGEKPNGYLVFFAGAGLAWLGTMVIVLISDFRLRRGRLR